MFDLLQFYEIHDLALFEYNFLYDIQNFFHIFVLLVIDFN